MSSNADFFLTSYNVLNNSELQLKRDNITNIKNVRKVNFWVHAQFFDSCFHQVKVERLVPALRNYGKIEIRYFSYQSFVRGRGV